MDFFSVQVFKNAQTLETQDSYLNTKLNTKNPLGVQVFNSHPNSRPHDPYPVHLPSIERPAGQAGSEMVTFSSSPSLNRGDADCAVVLGDRRAPKPHG